MVSTSTALESANLAGIKGRAARFIHGLLTGRVFKVRLGSTLSDIRCHNEGLPRGSVLSPLLFNLVMAGLPAALPVTTPSISISLYADDISIWAASKSPSALWRALQTGITAVNDYVTSKGLQLSTAKTEYMLIGPGAGWGRLAPLALNNNSLKRVKTTKFLGVTLDSRLSWVPLTKDIKLRCQTSLNLTRRLGNPASGCPQKTIEMIHNALTVSRVMYAYLYAALSESSRTTIERIHLRGLKSVIGVPISNRNVATYAEVPALPLTLLGTRQLLLQLTLLQKTKAGRALLGRLQKDSIPALELPYEPRD